MSVFITFPLIHQEKKDTLQVRIFLNHWLFLAFTLVPWLLLPLLSHTIPWIHEMNSWQWSFLPFINIKIIYRSINNLLEYLFIIFSAFLPSSAFHWHMKTLEQPAGMLIIPALGIICSTLSINSLCSVMYLSQNTKMQRGSSTTTTCSRVSEEPIQHLPFPTREEWTPAVGSRVWKSLLTSNTHTRLFQALGAPAGMSPENFSVFWAPKTKPSSCSLLPNSPYRLLSTCTQDHWL